MRHRLLPAIVEVFSSDIRAGRYLDAYAAIAVTAGLALFSAVGWVEGPVAGAIILGTLSIILLMLLAIRRTLDGKHGDMEFSVMSDGDYAQEIRRAKTITCVTIANYRFLEQNKSALLDFVRHGGNFNEVLADQDDIHCLKISCRRANGRSETEAHSKKQWEMTLSVLEDIQEAASEGKGSVKVFKVPYPTAHVITMFEYMSGPPAIYVIPTGYKQATDSRPTLRLERRMDKAGYDFFDQYVKNLMDERAAVQL